MDAAFIGRFVAQRDEVLGWVEQIEHATGIVNALHEESKTSVDPAKDAEISAKLNRATSRARDLAGKAKAVLDKSKAESAKLAREKGKDDLTYKTHKQHYSLMVNRYVDAMKEHQAAKEAFRSESKHALKRRAKYFYPDMTDEELEVRIDESPADLFQRELMRDRQASEEVRRTYDEVQSRAQDVEMLARSIQEVHEMFVDFAAMVAHQAEQIDSIELLVEGARARVAKGNVEIEKAIEYQRKARKRACCLAVCVLVILGVVAGVIAIQL